MDAIINSKLVEPNFAEVVILHALSIGSGTCKIIHQEVLKNFSTAVMSSVRA